MRKLGARLAPGPAGRAELSVERDRAMGPRLRAARRGSPSPVATSPGAGPSARGADAWISGPLTLKSADVFPALAALGLARSGLGRDRARRFSADLEAGPEWRAPDRRSRDCSPAPMSRASSPGSGTRLRRAARRAGRPERRRPRSPARWSSTAPRSARCCRSSSVERGRRGPARCGRRRNSARRC